MQRQSLYIAAQLTWPFVVVALCLAGIVWLTQSLRFVDLIVNHDLSIAAFLLLTLLLMPKVLVVILPVALFVGVLHAYHRLIADSELVILRATGSSNLRLAAPAIALGSAVAVAILAINLYLMPTGFRAFKDRQFELRHSLASVLVREGVFNTPLDGVTVFVRERAGGSDLRGILVHDARDPNERVTVIAERGTLLATPEGPRFVLENGSRQHAERDRIHPSFLLFDRYTFDFADEVVLPAGRRREASERYLHELIWPEEGVDERRRHQFRAEAWDRLTAPLNAIVLALIASAALLSGDVDRRGQFWRIVTGACAGGVFLAAALGLRYLTVGKPWLSWIFCLAIVACGLAAAWPLIFEGKRRGVFRARTG